MLDRQGDFLLELFFLVLGPLVEFSLQLGPLGVVATLGEGGEFVLFGVVVPGEGGAGDCLETEVVLLNDGGVETVEVQQQHDLVVEALLRLQHQSSRVLLLLLHLLLPLPLLLRVELVRQQVVVAEELVHQQHFVTFCPGVLQAAQPQVACNVGLLQGQFQDLQFAHQLVLHQGLSAVVLHQSLEALRGGRLVQS